jgi:hypothetical protein
MAAAGFGAGFAAAGGAAPPPLVIPLRGPRPRIAAGLPGGGAGLPLGPRGGFAGMRVGANGLIYHKKMKNTSKMPNTILAWMASPEIGVDFDHPVTNLNDFEPETIYLKMPKYQGRGVIGVVTTDLTPATAASGYIEDVIFDPAFIYNTEGDIIRATVWDRYSSKFRFDRDRETYYPVKAHDLGEIADIIRRANYESMNSHVNAATALRLAEPVPASPVEPVNFGRFALPAGPQVNVKGEYGPARSRKRNIKRKSRKSRKN